MTPRERLFALEQFGVKLGLDNITTLVNALDRPDRCFPSVHVGGTNGKGSVTAMVERGLRAAGHRTGRYTSPHLVAIEERMVVDGVPIDGETFDAVADEVLAVAGRLQADGALPHPPTFFEATTAIAFDAFRRAGVTAAVIEVGLGGRFDATNVITPVVTAITSIDRDHEKHLGHTLQEIAFEKAGIIKPHVPVVVGLLPPEADEVISAVAERQQAPLMRAVPAEHGAVVPLALAGAHQRANAAVAVATLRQSAPLGRPIAYDHLVAALTDVEWPARLEWLRLPDAGDVLIDAAHNPAGARALAAYVRSTVGSLPMVIGVMRDKDADGIIRELAPAVTRFMVTPVDSPRAMPPHDLAVRIRTVAPEVPCDVTANPTEAAVHSSQQHGRVVVAGSIFLVGPLRTELLARGASPVRYPSTAIPFYLE
jgi:dihydrofolate synthase/folylpolyglutamate synthase